MYYYYYKQCGSESGSEIRAKVGSESGSESEKIIVDPQHCLVLEIYSRYFDPIININIASQ
jgi:hypothetical protein